MTLYFKSIDRRFLSMNYIIDWLTLTIKPEKDNVTYSQLHMKGDLCPLENWCFEFLELTDLKELFQKKQGSVQHYNTMFRYNGIDIALSSSSRFSEQGLMFRFSGDGVAFYEKYMRERHSEWSWITFLKEFFSLGVFGITCRCTRIDLAFDDISKDDKDRLIDLKIVAKALEKGEFVSAFRKTDEKSPCDKLIPAYRDIMRNTKGNVIGKTYYVGNRKSKVFLRFYDKLLECKAKKEPYDEDIKHWCRMEFEFKDVRAMTVCDSLIMLTPEEFGTYISKVTNHYIRFIIPKGTRENYYKCNSRKWWKKIVGTVEKSKLTNNKAYRNRYYSTIRWLKKQVFPTLYAVLHCIKVDELITDIRDIGLSKYNNGNNNYGMIVNDYFNDRESEQFKGIEIHKASYDDFENILAELDKVAYSSKMRLKVLNMCKALSLDDERKKLINSQSEEIIEQYRIMHKPHKVTVNGLYDHDITEFMNEKQCYDYFPF